MRKLTTLFLGLILLTSCGENEVDSSKLVERGGLTYEVNSETPFTGVSAKYDNKKLRVKRSYREGKLNGPSLNYYDNGRIKKKGTYKDGEKDSPWVRYHKNGQLERKGTFKDGKRDGPWVYYHDKGQLRAKGTYKDGKRDGPWVEFHYNGTVYEKYTGTYKNGKKISD